MTIDLKKEQLAKLKMAENEMPNYIDITKQIIEIPDFYTFTEEWCYKNIRAVYDLDSICKTKDAEYEFCRFLEEIGAEMYMAM